MKTNYMNIRQQMFTISLAIVTVISLAWIKPSKAEKTTPKLSQQKHIVVAGFNIKQEPIPPQAPAVPKLPQKPKAPSAHAPAPPCPPAPLTVPDAPAKYVYQDTTKKKLKYTIITVDEKGNKKEYQSVKEMPESIRNQVIKETFQVNHEFDNDLKIRIDTIVNNSLAFLRSPEWKKSMDEITAKAGNIEQYFNSAQWKKQQDEIRKNAENIGAYFNSKEWKKQQENIRKTAEEIGKKAVQQQQLIQKIDTERRAREKEAKEKNP